MLLCQFKTDLWGLIQPQLLAFCSIFTPRLFLQVTELMFKPGGWSHTDDLRKRFVATFGAVSKGEELCSVS